MDSLFLLKPDAGAKRRRFAGSVNRTKTSKKLSIEQIKSDLRASSDFSITNLRSNGDALATVLAKNTAGTVSVVEDAAEAAAIALKISRGAPVGIGKSSIVAKEIKPELEKADVKIVDTYFNEFDACEKRFEKPWQLREPDYGIVFDSYQKQEDIGARRNEWIAQHGCKDFTGILGVNAVSLEDGSIFLLQHMSNIEKIFYEARRLILVIGLDKIAETNSDALKRAQAMAVFGSKLIPLSIGLESQDEKGMPYSALQEIKAQTDAEEIHIIIMDNGRSRFLGTPYQDLLACIGCRSCMVCPAIPAQADVPGWSPKEYTHYYLMKHHLSLQHCLQCQSCRVACPLSIDIPAMVVTARSEFRESGIEHLRKTMFANLSTVAGAGKHFAGIANTMGKVKPLRAAGEKIFNISKERQLPEIQKSPLAEWYKKRDGRK